MVLPITSQLNRYLHSSVRSALRQLKYSSGGSYLLVSSVPGLKVEPWSAAFPLSLELTFSLSGTSARIDLARVSYLYRRLFFKKPSYVFRPPVYRVRASFSGLLFDRLLSAFLAMRFYSQTKFLKFFYVGDSLTFTLAEPLTFFPLVHPAFDYYDWKMPFVFALRTSWSSSPRRLDSFNRSVLLRFLGPLL
jgi:hypothetical protein